MMVVATALVVFGAACGGENVVEVMPASVPRALTPERVHNSELAFYESELPSVKNAFANAPPNSLAADGRLMELRKSDRLVGTLQVTTLLPDVDLENKEHRDKILKQIMPSLRDEILIDEVTVWTTASEDMFRYLWFGTNMYSLLTIKGGSEDDLDPELVLSEVVAKHLENPNWEPLFIEEELEDL